VYKLLITEIVFALEPGEKVIGVDTCSDYRLRYTKSIVLKIRPEEVRIAVIVAMALSITVLSNACLEA